VFLREITRRLIDGLATHIPDLEAQRRAYPDHPSLWYRHHPHHQSAGAPQSLLLQARPRAHSIAKTFASDAGNIWFERMQHTWGDTKCIYCGAPKIILDRDESLENYAYAFIHTDNIKARVAHFFGGNMQFDVIIGNPPYQMKGGAGGTSDSSIYHLFVEQAQRL
jgi:site-specific DNA-methyltransferase (adenine-specific)